MKIVSVNLHLPFGVGANSQSVEEVRSLLASGDSQLKITTVVYGKDVSIRPAAISAIVYNAQPAVIKMEGDDVSGFVRQVEQAIVSAREFSPAPVLARGHGKMELPAFVGAS